ncbi:MAG TPA: calcium-binding protein [Solirubrobacteraceae bacterium]|jgi:hypothetical protein
MPKLHIVLTAACAAALYAPGSASALVSCDFDKDQKRLDVTITANGNYANVQRNGAEIRVAGAVCTDNGTIATVNNTDKVVVTDTSPDGATTTGVNTFSGLFVPGATAEGNGTSEIEFEIDGGGGADRLLLLGSNGPDEWELGAVPGGSGVNLNAGSESAIGYDVDVTTDGINAVDTAGDSSDDDISASGPAPFDGPLGVPVELDGQDGADHLVGGGVGDTITGGDGDDALFGGGGGDLMSGGDDRDLIQGSIGTDTVDYEAAPAGVRVDLRSAQYQDTGGEGIDMLTGVENLRGSDFDDVLIAGGGANVLDGREGDDSLTGGAGSDSLDGKDGSDTVSYATAADGVGVNLALIIQDTGGAGTDTIHNAENIVGSPFDDILLGDDAENTIEGGAGGDELAGQFGADTLLIRDGEGDSADCGGATDSVVTDEPGVDTLAGCENVDALPAPVVEPQPPVVDQPPVVVPPADQPPTQPAGGPAPALDTTKPVIALLRRRGARLVVRVSERSRLAVVIVRDRGRRARPRFKQVRTLSRAAGTGRTRVRLPRGLKAGRYRAVVVATDAAGNRSAKRSVAFRVKR